MTDPESLFLRVWSDRTGAARWRGHPRHGRIAAAMVAATAIGAMLTTGNGGFSRPGAPGNTRDGLSRSAMSYPHRIDRPILLVSTIAAAAASASVIAEQSRYAQAVLASQPSGYWRFEEETGPFGNAVAGASVGTASGNLTRGVASMNPSLGACVRFSAGGVTIPGSAATRPGPTYSVEMWVRVETPASPAHAITVGRDISPGSFDVMYYYCTATGCVLNAQLRLSNQPPATATNVLAPIDTPELLEWRHVVVTFDQPAGVMRLYVDGTVNGESPVPSTALAPNNSNFVIGMHDVPGFPYYFRGLIDEVAVYQRALTADEVRAHFCAANGVEPVCCPADLYPNGVVNGADLGILLSEWGSTEPVSADLNGDGTVDGIDLGALLGAWGSCPD